MKPYYSEAGITIYHGDCRDVFDVLRACDLIVTDPPYGINWRRGVNNARNSKAHEGIQGDSDTASRDWLLDQFPHLPAIVFGSFYAPFPANLKQVLVWQKPSDSGLVGCTTGYRRDAEPIFLCGRWPVRTVERTCVHRSTRGMGATALETGHPHTKPVPLLNNLIQHTNAQIIADPFMGSGSTLVAAKQLSRRAIGIEIEEKYCEIAAKRLAQGVLDFQGAV